MEEADAVPADPTSRSSLLEKRPGGIQHRFEPTFLEYIQGAAITELAVGAEEEDVLHPSVMLRQSSQDFFKARNHGGLVQVELPPWISEAGAAECQRE